VADWKGVEEEFYKKKSAKNCQKEQKNTKKAKLKRKKDLRNGHTLVAKDVEGLERAGEAFCRPRSGKNSQKGQKNTKKTPKKAKLKRKKYKKAKIKDIPWWQKMWGTGRE